MTARDLASGLRDRRQRREASLDRLNRYRAALDRWHHHGRRERLPQPGDFGLDLPDLKPGDVFCAPS